MRNHYSSHYSFFCALCTFAQNRSVNGSVTDEKGEPLVGATISVIGSGQNTTTGVTGNFQVQVAANARQLEITYAGFTTQRVTIGSRSTLAIKLAPANSNLSEVVVVAYGTVKKEALTGSVGQIGAKQIRDRPINNVTNAVEGAVPGVVVSSANGQPGSGNAIRVRGFGSVNASLDPLFVVDGVPYLGGTSNLNPDDVENITVLKDAASTALYGSRAANGVVIITTKKGQKGRNNVSVRVLQGVASRGCLNTTGSMLFSITPSCGKRTAIHCCTLPPERVFRWIRPTGLPPDSPPAAASRTCWHTTPSMWLPIRS